VNINNGLGEVGYNSHPKKSRTKLFGGVIGERNEN
jgi:hypothetical protein